METKTLMIEIEERHLWPLGVLGKGHKKREVPAWQAVNGATPPHSRLEMLLESNCESVGS